MKKLFYLILILFVPVLAFADGTVTQTAARVSSHVRTLTFVCTGDASDGSVPNTDTNTANTAFIQGWYLYKVEAFPTSGGVAPDAASVMIWDDGGLDLLGSEDNLTAYAGLNLVHAASKRACLGNIYLPRAGLHANYHDPIKSALTIHVADQSTASAEYTLVLTFVR